MRILALVGSPRKGGNTDILTEEVLRGARDQGHDTEKLRLYDYEILPCRDCRRCKNRERGYSCALSDGMQEIYPQLERADVIVFGTPIYWYGPTAKMKLLIDRLRPFISSQGLSVEGNPGCESAEMKTGELRRPSIAAGHCQPPSKP